MLWCSRHLFSARLTHHNNTCAYATVQQLLWHGNYCKLFWALCKHRAVCCLPNLLFMFSKSWRQGWVCSKKRRENGRNVISFQGMASVASDMGWLWTGWITPTLLQMSGMLAGRRDLVIVCGLLQGLVVFLLTSRFFVNSHLDHSRAWIPACSLTAALLHSCFPSNLSTTTQGAIVKLRGASSELFTLFIWSV